ncbi:MAG: hypothetical protein BWY26_01469 [Elusimicrobia bacterium ADurb.Bin231]|nr:MAG: hypothetical protein BWY26_01469 [Elusimicrobia bacterium ADurb.Bin231]
MPKSIYAGKEFDAKAVGMGETFVSVADNTSASYWNPAGLKQLQRNYFTFAFNPYIASSADKDKIYSECAIHGKDLLFMGIVIDNIALTYRPVSYYSENNSTQETVIRAGKYTLSSASQYSPKIALGLNMSYITGSLGISDKLANNVDLSYGYGVCADWGIIYSLSESARIGFAAENAPGYIWWDGYKYAQIPSHLRTGLSITPFKWLLMSAEYENYATNSDRDEAYHIGMQQILVNGLFVREGMISEKPFNKGKASAYTCGVGVEVKKDLMVDIAMKMYELDDTEKSKVRDYHLSVNLPF